MPVSRCRVKVVCRHPRLQCRIRIRIRCRVVPSAAVAMSRCAGRDCVPVIRVPCVGWIVVDCVWHVVRRHRIHGTGARCAFALSRSRLPCSTPGPQESATDSLAATWLAGHLCPSAVRTLPLPSPIFPPSRFPYSGRYKRGMASELRALPQPGLEY
eukprot:scaffold10255_cov152-Isochrysis_galbana.AAC.1